MSVYDLYQYYLNQLQNPVMDSPVVQQEAVNPLLYLQQQQGGEGEGSTDNTTTPTSNAGITSISGFADYLGSPGMIGGALFGPFGAVAGRGIAELIGNIRDPNRDIFGRLNETGRAAAAQNMAQARGITKQLAKAPVSPRDQYRGGDGGGNNNNNNNNNSGGRSDPYGGGAGGLHSGY